MPVDKSGKQTKQTGEVIDFPFENFIADSFKDLVDKQRTDIGKKELKENPQNTLDTKASNYTYIMALSQPGIKHPETQFIYFKNDAELITFKNTLIQSSTIGKSFIRQQSSDDGVIRQALSRNKGARAEAVFSAIEKTINEKRRLRERETKLVSQTPKQVAPVSPPKIESPLVKKQLNYKSAISFIRKLAIFQSVTNEQIIAMEEGFKEEENARYHKVQTFFKNYALKKARFERKKLVQCMKTKTVIKSSALFPQTQTDNTDYGIIYPRMYFDIHFTSTGELQKISNSSLGVFKLFILLTNEIYSSENVLYFSSDELDLASIPGYSVLRQSEFKVVGWKHHGIRLLNSDFKYLMVYKVNSESHNVEAIGYEEIPKKTTLAFEVSLKPCSYASDSQGTSGKLVFSNNHHIVTPEEVESKVSSSLSVKNFKYLSKLYSEKESDTSLSRTVGIYGLKSHFSTFRDSILRKYAFERYLSEKSSVIHDLIEWNIFERTVDKSIREYNRSLINDMAQSHHTLPLNSDAMVDKETIIYSSFQYEQLALSLNLPKSQQRGSTSPELSSSSNDFIYFGRYQWHKCRDLHVEKDSTLKAMVTGVPTWMCLNVWKSLGKIELLRALVSQSVNNASGSPGASKPAYQYLLEKGKDVDLTNYQDCKKEIEDLKYMSNRSTSVVQRTTGLVRAYLALAEVLDEYTLESSIEQVPSSPSEIYRMPLLSGLTLRTFSKIVQIIERLAFYYEEYLANYDNYKKELDKNGHSNLLNHSRVIEEDLFYILIAISIVFLPEHFLIPLPNSASNKPLQLSALERLGLDLDNVFQNRMFISSSAIGDYKLAVLFAECIRKTNSSVFNKMANLGFPFTSFCFEATETLFCNLFNDSMLCKIWQLIFFEGSSNIKRRAQQAMLSILVALVNLCGSLILEAQSGDEILWQLTAVAQQLYDRSEFMIEVIKIRKQLFIHNDLEVVAWIEDIVNLDPRLEVQLQTIKTAMHDQLDGVANSNYCYLKYLTTFASGLKDDKKAESLQKSAMSLYSIFNSFEVVSDIKGQNTVQSLILQMADMEYVLKEKPQANKLLVTVANFLEGNYIPNSSHFTITSTVNNDQIKIGLGPVKLCLI